MVRSRLGDHVGGRAGPDPTPADRERPGRNGSLARSRRHRRAWPSVATTRSTSASFIAGKIGQREGARVVLLGRRALVLGMPEDVAVVGQAVDRDVVHLDADPGRAQRVEDGKPRLSARRGRERRKVVAVEPACRRRGRQRDPLLARRAARGTASAIAFRAATALVEPSRAGSARARTGSR